MKLVILLSCMMAFLLAAPGVWGILEGSNLDIVLVGQSPLPVEPGSNVVLDINIENSGFGEALDTIVEINAEYPFTLITGDKVKRFLSISSENSVKSSYTLYVNDSVLTNTYEVEFLVYSNKTEGLIRKDISVSVRGDPKLVLTDVQVSPVEIEPGSMVDINARIKNMGTGKASYMEVSLNSSSSFLVPVLSGGSVYVDELGPGAEAELNFKISIDTSAEYKTYITSLTTDYKDESNEVQRTIFDIGIPVRGVVNLDIINMEANQERGRLRIEVANKGTSEVKSLEAKLLIDGETIGVDYLTNLKANKHTTFDFPLVYTGSGQLVIDYIGPGIEQNQVIKDIVLDFDSPGGGNGSLGLGVLFFIIVVAAVIIYFKKFRKKK